MDVTTEQFLPEPRWPRATAIFGVVLPVHCDLGRRVADQPYCRVEAIRDARSYCLESSELREWSARNAYVFRSLTRLFGRRFASSTLSRTLPPRALLPSKIHASCAKMFVKRRWRRFGPPKLLTRCRRGYIRCTTCVVVGRCWPYPIECLHLARQKRLSSVTRSIAKWNDESRRQPDCMIQATWIGRSARLLEFRGMFLAMESNRAWFALGPDSFWSLGSFLYGRLQSINAWFVLAPLLVLQIGTMYCDREGRRMYPCLILASIRHLKWLRWLTKILK